MKLLDKSLSKSEKESCIDSLEGNIARICVSDDVEEIICQLGFATDRLSMLAYSRVKEVMENDNNLS